MNSTPPFVRQERSDTCALACLRMLLRHYSTDVAEAELVQVTPMEVGGVEIEDLAQVAERFGFRATLQAQPEEALADLVAQGRFPIVYLNRWPFDREFAIHAVIPARFTRHYTRRGRN